MPGLVFLLLSFLINSINYEQHELTILPNSRNERTFVLVKPDSVQRGYFGDLLSRLEKKGFRLVLMKFLLPEKEIMEEHYEEHRNNPSFDERIQYMLTGPVVALVWEGPRVIAGGCWDLHTLSRPPLQPSEGTSVSRREEICVMLATPQNLPEGKYISGSQEVKIYEDVICDISVLQQGAT